MQKSSSALSIAELLQQHMLTAGKMAWNMIIMPEHAQTVGDWWSPACADPRMEPRLPSNQPGNGASPSALICKSWFYNSLGPTTIAGVHLHCMAWSTHTLRDLAPLHLTPTQMLDHVPNDLTVPKVAASIKQRPNPCYSKMQISSSHRFWI